MWPMGLLFIDIPHFLRKICRFLHVPSWYNGTIVLSLIKFPISSSDIGVSDHQYIPLSWLSRFQRTVTSTEKKFWGIWKKDPCREIPYICLIRQFIKATTMFHNFHIFCSISNAKPYAKCRSVVNSLTISHTLYRIHNIHMDSRATINPKLENAAWIWQKSFCPKLNRRYISYYTFFHLPSWNIS